MSYSSDSTSGGYASAAPSGGYASEGQSSGQSSGYGSGTSKITSSCASRGPFYCEGNGCQGFCRGRTL